MLVDAVRRATLPPRATALDLCSGSGAVAIAAALRGVRSVTAIDVDRRSTWTVGLNARLNRVRVRALRGDLFEPVVGRRFDLITANPPYLPAPPDIAPRRGDRAWNAGGDGRTVIDRIIEELPEHLAPGGCFLMVQSSVTGTRETLDRLADAGLQPAIAERRRGPLGPLMAGRVDYLISEGLLRGPRLEEEVLVIAARRSRVLVEAAPRFAAVVP
jgi:release factor glutamine methyltransferase